MKSLFVVSGEISGDTHGAALLRALIEAGEGDWRISGLGGPQMSDCSPDVEDWLEEAAVLGLWEVLRKYGYFRSKMEETVSRIQQTLPEGVLLVDYPGFNLRLAKRLRDGGYRGKLVYYISPQVWAWKKGRVRNMAKWLDLMICIFPFEKALYEESGLRTVFAGHPLVDEMAEVRDPSLVREENLVALLPGSREREIVKLFPPMLDAAVELLQWRPHLRFATTGTSRGLTDRLREMVEEKGLEDVFAVGDESSHRLMQRAAVGVVASGTATLEAACLGLPYCLVYKVAWLTAQVAQRVMSVDHLGIVNVLAGREVVKELLQKEVEGIAIVSEVKRLLDDPAARRILLEEMEAVVRGLGGGGCHVNAAAAITRMWESDERGLADPLERMK